MQMRALKVKEFDSRKNINKKIGTWTLASVKSILTANSSRKKTSG
jgi:hypothetical protein